MSQCDHCGGAGPVAIDMATGAERCEECAPALHGFGTGLTHLD